MKMKLYDFRCQTCAVDFVALSMQNGMGQVVDVLHEPCGQRVAQIRPKRPEWFHCNDCRGEFCKEVTPDEQVQCPRCQQPMRMFYPLGTKMNFRSSETIPPDLRREFVRSEGFLPETRAGMDRYMAERGLSFTDNSYAKRELHPDKLAEQRLAPETNDVEEVRRWNAEHYGAEFVRQQDAEIGEAWDRFAAGADVALPSEKGDTVIHETPHVVDLDRVTQNVTSADETKGLTWACDASGNRIMPVATEGA